MRPLAQLESHKVHTASPGAVFGMFECRARYGTGV